MHFIAFISIFATVIYTANGLCNTCGIYGVACATNTAFQLCVDGLPQGDAIECPGSSVCSPSQQVCMPAGSPSSCGKCNTCSASNIFACRDYSKFSFCNENGTDATVYDCPTGLVCNIDSAEICVNSNNTGIGATCPLPATTTSSSSSTTSTTTTTLSPITTTPNPLTQPNEYCERRGTPGRYGIASNTSCNTYISCILSGTGQWIGNLYMCPTNTYFNPTSQTCSKVRPTVCAL